MNEPWARHPKPDTAQIVNRNGALDLVPYHVAPTATYKWCTAITEGDIQFYYFKTKRHAEGCARCWRRHDPALPIVVGCVW